MGRAPGSFPQTPGPQERSKCGLGPIGNDKVTRTLLPRLRTISQWCILVNRECILCFAFACRHTCPNRTNPMRPVPSAGWRLGIHLDGGWDSQISQVAPISGGTELPGWVKSGSPAWVMECPLLGVKRKSISGGWRSSFSQSRTFRPFRYIWIFGSPTASLQGQGDQAWNVASLPFWPLMWLATPV